ncbi:MAG: hypothetical protein JWM76_4124 [Pseudonocardiales bacterium]|nr:hypothetical protein [Pseudonocardiales bacterium]
MDPTTKDAEPEPTPTEAETTSGLVRIVRRSERDERSAVSADDTDLGWSEPGSGTTRDDDWYRRERPPHHEG